MGHHVHHHPFPQGVSMGVVGTGGGTCPQFIALPLGSSMPDPGTHWYTEQPMLSTAKWPAEATAGGDICSGPQTRGKRGNWMEVVEATRHRVTRPCPVPTFIWQPPVLIKQRRFSSSELEINLFTECTELIKILSRLSSKFDFGVRCFDLFHDSWVRRVLCFMFLCHDSLLSSMGSVWAELFLPGRGAPGEAAREGRAVKVGQPECRWDNLYRLRIDHTSSLELCIYHFYFLEV